MRPTTTPWYVPTAIYPSVYSIPLPATPTARWLFGEPLSLSLRLSGSTTQTVQSTFRNQTSMQDFQSADHDSRGVVDHPPNQRREGKDSFHIIPTL